MAIIDFFSAPTAWPLSITLMTLLFLSISAFSLQALVFHPLRSIPGPFIARVTPIWLWYHAWKGDEASQIQVLHERYGPVVRVAPNDIDIADGAALHAIYSEKGGFLKHPCYANFYIEGHPTIFSALDPEYRKPRAKAVAPLWSTNSIYSNSEHILTSADTFIERLCREADTGKPVNVLNLARCFALDSVSAYLFGVRYGGLDEENQQLSASKFVDFFVAFGRFFYLPAALFGWMSWISEKLWLDDASAKSLAKVDAYAHDLVEQAAQQLEKGDSKVDQTYQMRLLRASCSKHETEQQCKDLMFAGTDSTGMNIATICWQLTRPCHAAAYERLREELVTATADNALATDSSSIQALPYLRAVVLEGLRMSNANPTRLPRIVGPNGWSWLGYHFPPGTSVGVGALQLHTNEEHFPDSGKFLPERWLNASPEMQRDSLAFGVGARQCIARNLAMAELLIIVARIAEKDALSGLRAVGDEIEIVEWFNAMVPGGRVELKKMA